MSSEVSQVSCSVAAADVMVSAAVAGSCRGKLPPLEAVHNKHSCGSRIL